MKAVRLISLIARVALMATMVLGLVFWIAQMPVLSRLLTLLVQIHVTTIHEGFGLIGVLALLVLGSVAVWARGIRLLGAGSMIYALLVPAFGLTQALIMVGDLHWVIQTAHLLVGIGAMLLARSIEKRYDALPASRRISIAGLVILFEQRVKSHVGGVHGYELVRAPHVNRRRRPFGRPGYSSLTCTCISCAQVVSNGLLFGLFSPFIHCEQDFPQRFPFLGQSILDMEREPWKDVSGQNTCLF